MDSRSSSTLLPADAKPRVSDRSADCAAPEFRFNLAEAAGGLGDLGIFIPLLAGLVNRCGVHLGPALFLAGAMNLLTGLLFRIPMPVQPMKAIAAAAISERLTETQVLTAGICCSVVVLVLGLTRSIDWLSRYIPKTVVRGLQLALGLKLLFQGLGMITKNRWLGWDSISVGMICGILAFGLRSSTRLPAALVIFALGMITLIAGNPALIEQLHFGFDWHCPAFPTVTDWRIGTWRAGMPQVPLTLMNSVIAVCALSKDLFPQMPAQPRRVAVSVALMNLICCPLGGIPMCHGAGGLAGQYRFGARSGGSIVMLGAAKMILALLFGGSLWLWLQNYPQSVLGVLLFCSGLELAVVCRDQKSLATIAVMVIVAIMCLIFNMAVGFLAGWPLAAMTAGLGWLPTSKGRK